LIFEVLVSTLKLETRLCELAPGTGMRDATRNEALPAGWDMAYSVRRFNVVRLILELPE